MKRILLFGATGRTGRHVLSYALEKGYSVTALVRNPEKLAIESKHLKVVKGYPTNADDVKFAMAECDILISTLSALSQNEAISFRKVEAPHTLETSIRNAIQSMHEFEKKRIIILSSIGAGDSFHLAPWYMRLFIKISNFKIVFADHNRQEALVMGSNLDWTIARPVALNDDITIRKLAVSYTQTPSPFRISRKQLAKFLVDCIDDSDFVKKAPILSEHS